MHKTQAANSWSFIYSDSSQLLNNKHVTTAMKHTCLKYNLWFLGVPPSIYHYIHHFFSGWKSIIVQQIKTNQTIP